MQCCILRSEKIWYESLEFWLAVIPQEIYLSCGSRAIPFWIFTKVLSNISAMSFEKLVICVASTRRAALQSLQYIMTSKIKSTKAWSGVIVSQFLSNFTQKETFWNSHQAKILKWIRRLEWRFSCQQFEDQNTQCPPVDIDVMPASLAEHRKTFLFSAYLYLPIYLGSKMTIFRGKCRYINVSLRWDVWYGRRTFF